MIHTTPIDRHEVEMMKNVLKWEKKPTLRKVYERFYNEIIGWIRPEVTGKVVEIGAGIGNFKKMYPKSVSTDIFPTKWVDQVETAYSLSFEDGTVSHLVLFDVLHHLRFPGSALKEFERVLVSGGRVIICDPTVSVLGYLVYGVFHHEPVALFQDMEWYTPEGVDPDGKYYAAQGNSYKLFGKSSTYRKILEKEWKIVSVKRYSALSYVLCGGFSKPSFYPHRFLPYIVSLEKFFDLIPALFATRTMVVLEKK